MIIDTEKDDVFVPVMIERTANPIVTGVNSTWLVGLSLLVGWFFFGPQIVKLITGEKKKPQPGQRKSKPKVKR